jgi:hypothetical protein
VRAALIPVLILILAAGCSSEDIVDPDKLCRQGAALAARVDGGAMALDVCVSQDATDARYETLPNDHYEVTGTVTQGGVTFTLWVNFAVYPPASWPVTLTPTTDVDVASNDPNFVYFYVRETDAGQDLRSMDVTGNFTLSFSDASIAVAAFSNMTVTMEDAASPGTSVGTRTISEGFVSVSAD